MAVISLKSGPVSSRINTRGGCLLRLDYDDIPLLRPAAQDAAPIDSGCYPLVPFGNRVRGNRFRFEGRDYDLSANTDWDPHYLHGEGWRSEWAVTDQRQDSAEISHRHEGTALPYTYEASQKITLSPDGADLHLSVTNCGDRAMPFGIGWHPYFPMTPQTTLQTETGRIWTEEPGWLPGTPVAPPQDLDFATPRGLPHRWVNNCFERWSGRARIDWPEHGLALRITADPLFGTMFLFVSDVSFDPGYRRDFFALEPMSHLADGHNQPDLGGLVALAPGETLVGGLSLRVEQTSDDTENL